VWWALGARVVVTWRLGEVAPAWQCGWAPGAHVVVTWRLREVAPAWQCGWVLGAGEVAVFFTDRDESATSRCCGPYSDEFNKSS
jgi:hypothetical protein